MGDVAPYWKHGNWVRFSILNSEVPTPFCLAQLSEHRQPCNSSSLHRRSEDFYLGKITTPWNYNYRYQKVLNEMFLSLPYHSMVKSTKRHSSYMPTKLIISFHCFTLKYELMAKNRGMSKKVCNMKEKDWSTKIGIKRKQIMKGAKE